MKNRILFVAAFLALSLPQKRIALAQDSSAGGKSTEMMSNPTSADMQARMDKMSGQMEEMMKMMKDMHGNMGSMMSGGQCSMMGGNMKTKPSVKKGAKKATPLPEDHEAHHPEEKK